MSQDSAEFWIDALNLVEHPGDEDGYFVEAYRDPLIIKNSNNEYRNIGTVAYFLQNTSPEFSNDSFLFKCGSTEMLFYHYGAPLTILIYNKGVENSPDLVILGTQMDKGQVLSCAVPKDTWFTRRVEKEEGFQGEHFCVYSCSLLPGFELADFQAEKFGNLSL